MNGRTLRRTLERGIAVGAIVSALNACLPTNVGEEKQGGSHLQIDRSQQAKFSAEQLRNLTSVISNYLTTEFQNARGYLSQQYGSCENNQIVSHLRAKLVFGDAGQCVSLVAQCMTQTSGLNKGHIAYAGAQCAWHHRDYAKAYDWFREATKRDAYGADPEYQARVFEFARFSQVAGFEDNTADILALGFSNGNREEFLKMLSLVDVAVAANSSQFFGKDFKQFITARINGSALPLGTVLRAVYYSVLSGGDAKSRDALKLMETWIKSGVVKNIPAHYLHGFFIRSYGNVYRQTEGANRRRGNGLSESNRMYRAYLPFAQANYPMPGARNTYTYEDIRTRICRANVLSGADLETFNSIRQRWEAGSLSHQDALNQATALDKSPAKADLKTFVGNVHHMAGNLDEAHKAYHQAHAACNFYNRAHHGLRTLRTRFANRALANHDEQRTAFVNKGQASPSGLSAYVTNFRRLSQSQVKMFLASMDFMVPFINDLQRNGYRMYLKHTYQRLSELPGLSRLSGNRVGAFDNRLYDDIRGLATGKIILADLMLMEEIPFGENNVPLHEAAHQFHRAAPRAVKACITQLYRRARGRLNNQGLFSAGYAQTNEAEYFAMAVQHYAIPENAPEYMGVNRGWYLRNDPAMYAFIEKIKSANGVLANMSRLQCPPDNAPVPTQSVKRGLKAAVLKGTDGKGHFLAVRVPPRVDKAYVCFGAEQDCLDGRIPSLEMKPDDFAKGTPNYYLVHPYDLKLAKGQTKSFTVLGKSYDSAKYDFAQPVAMEL